MWRIPIRSRLGNAVLGILGAIYFMAATALLLWYVITNWGANGTIDRLLQFALFMSAVTGLFFVSVAAANLGIKLLHRGERSPSPPEHRTAAATRS